MMRFIAALGAALALACGPAFAQGYVALDLGAAVPGAGLTFQDWTARGLNNRGQVVGTVLTRLDSGWTVRRAFVTGPNGVGITLLGTLGGAHSFGNDVNDSGQVAGFSYTSSDAHAFVTGPGGLGLWDLGTPGLYSYATAINNRGQVSGMRNLANGSTRAFLTGPGGVGLTDIAPLPGQFHTVGIGINNSGQVVGYSQNATATALTAFVTGAHGVGVTALGDWLSDTANAGLRINDSGQIVRSIRSGLRVNVALTAANGVGMTDLGTLGGAYAYATDLNNLGQVVGYSATSSGERRAFVSAAGGQGQTDLNLLAGLGSTVLVGAWGINDLGQILANSADGRAFLLTPVPEPASLLLMTAGLMMLALLRRRAGA